MNVKPLERLAGDGPFIQSRFLLALISGAWRLVRSAHAARYEIAPSREPSTAAV